MSDGSSSDHQSSTTGEERSSPSYGYFSDDDDDCFSGKSSLLLTSSSSFRTSFRNMAWPLLIYLTTSLSLSPLADIDYDDGDGDSAGRISSYSHAGNPALSMPISSVYSSEGYVYNSWNSHGYSNLLLLFYPSSRYGTDCRELLSQPPTVVHWVRLSALRLHDNPAFLHGLLDKKRRLRCVFIIDPWFVQDKIGENR